MRIIPAIDIKDGKCVRLLQGDFEKSTKYSDDPAAIGRRFSALAVRDLHVVDLDGAQSGEQVNHEVVSAIAAESGLAVQLGGGIRQRSDIERWLTAGVTRCVVGSAAINHPQTVGRWIEELGPEKIVLALDINLDEHGTPILTTHGWTKSSGLSLWECLDGYSAFNVRHVLCTDVSRDGAMAGPNFELYGECLRRYPELELQASGGVRHIEDLKKLRSLNVPAAISGRALLDGEITEAEVAAFRQSA